MSTSPKLARGKANWYRYYAGYSSDFVREILIDLSLPKGAVVLDPWNGAGTTTAEAASQGLKSIGFDINPALVLVSRARLLGSQPKESLAPLCVDLLNHARADRHATVPDDPLLQWFDVESAARLRSIDRAVRRALIGPSSFSPMTTRESLGRVSSLAAFYLVALFDVVRELTSRFRSSNPTWIRVRSDAEPFVSSDWASISALMINAVSLLAEGASWFPRPPGVKATARVLLGDSRRLPLRVGSVDAIITSPPYCTRIDYVVATLPELAVIGMTRESTRAIREAMIGSPTIDDSKVGRASSWGSEAQSTLEKIRTHTSHASASYYARNITQYFDGMAKSLGQLARVTKAGGRLVLVAQDSHYKEVQIRLPVILTEMSTGLGWRLESSRDHFLGSTRAAVHPGTRAYRSDFSATESVLFLTRTASPAQVVHDQG